MAPYIEKGDILLLGIYIQYTDCSLTWPNHQKTLRFEARDASITNPPPPLITFNNAHRL